MSRRSTWAIRWPVVALAGGVLLAGAIPAQAHITARPNEAAAGGYFQTALTVSHGCKGSATVALRVTIPDGVASVKPQMKPGWRVDIRKRTLAAPQKGPHGTTITEVVDEVSWRGGPLPDHLFDSFGLVMKLPDRPGSTLYLPVVQECEQGELRWVERPAGSGGHLHAPAPAIRLKGKTDAHKTGAH
jgi:uncharacterized protein YcnI